MNPTLDQIREARRFKRERLMLLIFSIIFGGSAIVSLLCQDWGLAFMTTVAGGICWAFKHFIYPQVPRR